MDEFTIFLGWSGTLSQKIAHHLRDWLQFVIPDAVPWFSDEDIGKGSKWRNKLDATLSRCKASIIIVTKESKNSRWLLFEAGAASQALAESQDDKPCCTLLVDLTAVDVKDPLASFQASEFNKKDMRRLGSSLNQLSSLPTRERFDERFDQRWSRLEDDIKSAITEEVPSETEQRSERELIIENLLTSRAIRKSMDELLRTTQDATKMADAHMVDAQAFRNAFIHTMSAQPPPKFVHTSLGAIPFSPDDSRPGPDPPDPPRPPDPPEIKDRSH